MASLGHARPSQRAVRGGLNSDIQLKVRAKPSGNRASITRPDKPKYRGAERLEERFYGDP